MEQLDRLTARIAEAIARTDAALDRPPKPDPRMELLEAAHDQALTARDAAEAAQAGLEKELAAAREALSAAEGELALLRSEVETLRAAAETQNDQDAAIIRLDRSVQQVQHANEVLRASNADLRAASAEGMTEPPLLNESLQAEIDGLRAAREADAATAGAILSRLEPLLTNAMDLPEGEEE